MPTWWSELTQSECRQCGRARPVFARACPHCRALNTGRAAAFTVVAALVALAAAAAIAVVVVVGRHRLPAQAVKDDPKASTGARAPARADDDFTWLETAMQQCDDD